MADKPNSDDGVKIHAPDRALHAKIGNANLDQILTPKAIEAAQTAIKQSADDFLADSIADMKGLEQAIGALQKTPEDASRLLPTIIDRAFAIKAKAGLGGYDLVSSLAKSLHLHCEQLEGQKMEGKNLQIIQWHMSTIRQLLNGRIKGDGGPAGMAILAELGRLG